MAEKRKHVAFAEESIHPSRMAQMVSASNAQPAAKKPKIKSEKKKKYLAKKAKRHRVLAKAKRDSAPKNKESNDADSDGSEANSDAGEGGRLAHTINETFTSANAEAGPSKSPQVPKSVLSTDGASSDNEVAEKARRRQEKREKRASRDHDEKRRRKESKRLGDHEDKAKVEENSQVHLGSDSEMPDIDREGHRARHLDGGDDYGESHPDTEVQDNKDCSSDPNGVSPPALQAFPLPTPAAAPDPLLLAQQGLPMNLEKATIVDQDVKQPLRDTMLGTGGLGDRLEKRLGEMGITDLFAVQAAMLPHLLRLPLVPYEKEELDDYLISAPTGSGKTLAYAIPLVHILSQRKFTRLRALIVLPTRDLVIQVKETMEALAKGTDLQVGTVTGHHSFSHEQKQLVADPSERLLGGSSKVDILIATPGRLMDHLERTPNFTLQHLRFLVIDEADRLLNQTFHNWLPSVLSHTRPPKTPLPLPEGFVRQPWDAVAKNWQIAFGVVDPKDPWSVPPVSTCQKLLFSATLTRDPASIASLQLKQPRYFIIKSSIDSKTSPHAGESFALPSTLQERFIVVPPALKPLHLVHLLYSPEYRIRNGLVFTKSVDSVGRLVSLLQAFEEAYRSAGGSVVIRGYTSEMKPGTRKSILQDFADGRVDLLICSDVIARGLDLPSVEHVVSYDTPVDMRKYVHRVGRTARAGRAGTAWTLVEKQEALHFKTMLKTAGHDHNVRKLKVNEDELAVYKEAYEVGLAKVQELYSR